MKLYSPAAERNTGPLLSLLQRAFPARGLVLELAAATMNNMPRALEVADDFLRRDDNARRPVDTALLVEMFQYVFERARGKYSPSPPSIEVLSAMFFCEAVPLDDKARMNAVVTADGLNNIRKLI